ncbi:MAG: hypothetical protein JW929_04135 [Anaerolineales bacterium]|nr:hypothetical protein [Anaerolineales bacterium]
MQKKSRLVRLWIGALIFAALSAPLTSCGAGSLLPKEPSPTWTTLKTPTPTETPSPTPTVPPTEWPLAYYDSFDEASDDWQTGEMNNEYARGTLAILGGKYYIKLTAKKPLIWYCIPPMKDYADAYVSVKADQRGGTKTAEYGLVVRENPSSRYFFSISSLQGGYGFIKNPSGEPTVLTLWTYSSRILVGEPNQMAVKAEGGQFTLYLNGDQVDDARDSEAAEGKAGVGIILYKAGDSIEVIFDNFEVRSPEAA